MNQIKLSSDKVALVDDEDFEYLSQFKWYDAHGYAARNYFIKGKHIHVSMHREILGNIPSNVQTDHINGNKLDNRRENLRLCNNAQNNQNKGLTKDNTTGFKGLRWYKPSKRWQVRIAVYGKQIHLGYFKDITKAVKTYNTAAKKYHGEFAYQNII